MSLTNILKEFEKVNPRTTKVVEVGKGENDIRGRSKSQIFTK